MLKLTLQVAKITLVFVYLVILAGSIVRATGSGMGCPDWPKCFGKWVPPTNESELPDNYQEIYKDRGYADTSFNVYHTWTEYVNRLLGASLGLIIFILTALSFSLWKTNKKVVLSAIFLLLLTAFQGWLGAKVVSSNLAPFKITIHMLVAIIILIISIYIIQLLQNTKQEQNDLKIATNARFISKILLSIMALTIIQVLVGTSVREKVDTIASSFNYNERDKWILFLGTNFNIHRLIGYALVLLVVYFFVKVKKHVYANAHVLFYSKLLLYSVLIELVVGVILAKYAFPAFAQPIHLLFATIFIGIGTKLYLDLNRKIG